MQCHVKFGVLLLGVAHIGCSNVQVNKVSLSSRLQQSDCDVTGFRYYLNRPYIVVAKRVPIMTTYLPVRQGTSDGAVALRALVPDDTGRYIVFDADGNVAANQHNFISTAESTTSAAPPAPIAGPITADQKNKLQSVVILNSVFAIANTLLDSSNFVEVVGNPSQRLLDASSPAKKLDAAASDIKDIKTTLDTSFDKGIEALKTGLPSDDFTSSDKQLIAATVSLACAANIVNQLAKTQSTAIKTSAEEFIDLYKKLSEQTIKSVLTSVETDWTKQLQLALRTVQLQSGKLTAPQNAILRSIDDEQLIEMLQLSAPDDGQSLARSDPNGAKKDDGTTTGTQPAEQASAAIDAFQVAFLPDFEEQYAIQHYNCLAKAKYQMKFNHGTSLAGFAGSYDSTDVPVKILQTVGTLISEAGNVAKAAIDKTPSSTARSLSAAPVADFYLKIEHVIEPGFYRLQKSWERAACESTEGYEPQQYCGLFADIGLALIESRSVMTKKEFIAYKATLEGATAPAPDSAGSK